MTEPLVSVVTPFHNTAPFLAECIESVLKQRHANWEYVLLDNASTDGSTAIAQRYAAQDSRIRFIRRDDLVPQVPNYNRALAQVSPAAAYVKVLEADNWLFPNCLQEMVAHAEANPGVGIVSAYNSTETRLRLMGLPLATTVVEGPKLARRQLAGEIYVFGAPTTVLMRADLVRSRVPFYDESYAWAEDLSACFEALRSSDFGFVHQVLTFVRTENESILSRIQGFDAQLLDRLVLLHRHGEHFFTPADLARVRKRIEGDYYACLARGRLARQGEAFWRFHRKSLASEGIALQKSRLAAAVVRQAFAQALRPLGG